MGDSALQQLDRRGAERSEAVGERSTGPARRRGGNFVPSRPDAAAVRARAQGSRWSRRRLVARACARAAAAARRRRCRAPRWRRGRCARGAPAAGAARRTSRSSAAAPAMRHSPPARSTSASPAPSASIQPSAIAADIVRRGGKMPLRRGARLSGCGKPHINPAQSSGRVGHGAEAAYPRGAGFPEAGDPVLRHLDAARACRRLARDGAPARRGARAAAARSARRHRVARLPGRGAAWPTASIAASPWCARRASCRAPPFRYTYDLEYGTDTIEIQADAIAPGQPRRRARRSARDRRHHGGRGRALPQGRRQRGGRRLHHRARVPERPPETRRAASPRCSPTSPDAAPRATRRASRPRRRPRRR